MQAIPFLQSNRYRIIAVGLALFILLLQWTLLVYYVEIDYRVAFTESLFSVSAFIVLACLLWYASAFITIFQGEIILIFTAVIIWITMQLAGTYVGKEIFVTPAYPFVQTLLLRTVIGVLLWTLLLQWYKIKRLLYWKQQQIVSESVKSLQTEELNDRIAVKDGTRIHIIPLEELIYVQASGDYITLISPTGQYLKEQTMKSLESQLPSSRFVRVHRSFIVNVEHIKRVELHGKETYRVLLKNGEVIKASINGYKLLKEQLSL